MELRERRAILTFPRDMGTEVCWPKRVSEVQDRFLRDALGSLAQLWITKRAKEGEDYYDPHDIHIYGPFPSTDLIEPILLREHYLATDDERTQLILARDTEPIYAHYVLNAHFLVKPPGLAPATGVTTWQS